MISSRELSRLRRKVCHEVYARVIGLNPFKRVFDKFDKVAITGGPKVGKTTLAKMIIDRPVLHTDDQRGETEWSKQSENVMVMVNAQHGKCVIEGVRVPHALRKGMKVDAVIYLTHPWVEQTPRQFGMSKAVRTVFNEWRASHPDVPVFPSSDPKYSPFNEEEEDE